MPDVELSSPPPSDDPAVAPPAPPAPPDATGAGATVPDPAFAERIQRAAASAVQQHLDERPRKRGQRGPDRQPRKPRLPVAPLGNGAGEAPGAELQPEPLETLVAPAPAFDAAAAREVCRIALDLMNDGAAAVVAAVAKKETGDSALAAEAGKSVRMSDQVRSCVELGAIECAKKYAVPMHYAPETMLFGGLVVWGGQVAMAIRTLKLKGAELRQSAPAQEQGMAA